MDEGRPGQLASQRQRQTGRSDMLTDRLKKAVACGADMPELDTASVLVFL